MKKSPCKVAALKKKSSKIFKINVKHAKEMPKEHVKNEYNFI